MPVLINTGSGQAEDLPQQDADRAIGSGTHEIPLLDPDKNLVSATPDQAQYYLGKGYSQPPVEHLQNLLEKAKYQTGTEKLKAAAEKAASTATFGLSTGAEEALGISTPENIRKREELSLSPLEKMGAGAAGLIGSAFLPVGSAAKALGAVGKGAAELAGLGGEGAGLVSQMGSAAVKGAAETALIQAGDENSKLLSGDPNQSAETAAANIGLSSLYGAAIQAPFGAVSPVWKMAKESSVGKLLSAIKDKVNGSERTAIPTSIDQAIESTGINVPPEVRAAMGSDPELRSMFQTLRESQTGSGKAATESYNNFRKETQSALVRAVGKTPEQVDALSDLSPFEEGTKIKDTLSKELSQHIDPIVEKFDNVKKKYSGVELNDAVKADINNKINEFAQSKEYGLVPGSAEQALVNNALIGVKNAKTLESLRNLQSILGKQAEKDGIWGALRGIKAPLREAEENLVSESLGKDSPELFAEHQATRQKYGPLMNMIDDLNDRLHVGHYDGPGTFVKNLKEMAPEDVLRRLGTKTDAGLLNTVAEKFPQTGAAIKDWHLNSLLKAASNKASAGEILNPNVMFKAMDSWSPELKQYVLGGAQQKISSVQSLLEALPGRLNPSGTAGTLDKLWSSIPGGAGGLIGVLTGHGPLMSVLEHGIGGAIAGKAAGAAARNLPDMTRLSLLKFIGSDKAINPGAFKSSVDFISAMIDGEKAVAKSTKAVFKAGAEVLPTSLIPTEKKREKLDNRLKDLQSNNESLLKVGGDIGYYHPEHGSAIGAVAGRASEYLNSLRPQEAKAGPLDTKPVVSKAARAIYDRALDVAEQPLITMQSLKDGTLTTEDVSTLKTIYPGLYSRLSQKLTNEMIDHVSKGNSVPYSTRLSLSLFLGQALDSTMTPQGILAAQSTLTGKSNQQEGAEAMKQQSKVPQNALSKLAASNQTPQQARVSDKNANVS